MFNWKLPDEKTGLQKAHAQALLELDNFTTDDPEYQKILAHVVTLSTLVEAERPERLNPNTVLLVLGNVGIGVMFTLYESKNVVTTKVIPFLMKLK